MKNKFKTSGNTHGIWEFIMLISNSLDDDDELTSLFNKIGLLNYWVEVQK